MEKGRRVRDIVNRVRKKACMRPASGAYTLLYGAGLIASESGQARPTWGLGLPTGTEVDGLPYPQAPRERDRLRRLFMVWMVHGWLPSTAETFGPDTDTAGAEGGNKEMLGVVCRKEEGGRRKEEGGRAEEALQKTRRIEVCLRSWAMGFASQAVSPHPITWNALSQDRLYVSFNLGPGP
ncbi:hypothetical protein MKZ38_006553 [Zalerion maritima]|uniref:Uncharacterized protein n=1 Tax=Zalerion maritima TaxID=339359 RepID=A0AAD5S0U8_9PEZI|nr:hypothetical protein MKZ38_006553 [Zalerion maritima]